MSETAAGIPGDEAREALLRGGVVGGSLLAAELFLVLVALAAGLLPPAEVARGARELVKLAGLALGLGVGAAASAVLELRTTAWRGSIASWVVAVGGSGVAAFAAILAVWLSVERIVALTGGAPLADMSWILVSRPRARLVIALALALPFAVLTFARRFVPGSGGLQAILVGVFSTGPLVLLWAAVSLPGRGGTEDEGIALIGTIGITAFLSPILPPVAALAARSARRRDA